MKKNFSILLKKLISFILLIILTTTQLNLRLVNATIYPLSHKFNSFTNANTKQSYLFVSAYYKNPNNNMFYPWSYTIRTTPSIIPTPSTTPTPLITPQILTSTTPTPTNNPLSPSVIPKPTNALATSLIPSTDISFKNNFASSSITIKKNQKLQIKPDTNISDPITIKYTSSNKNYISVSSTGMLKGISAGKSTITVTTVYQDKIYSYKITVACKS